MVMSLVSLCSSRPRKNACKPPTRHGPVDANKGNLFSLGVHNVPSLRLERAIRPAIGSGLDAPQADILVNIGVEDCRRCRGCEKPGNQCVSKHCQGHSCSEFSPKNAIQRRRKDNVGEELISSLRASVGRNIATLLYIEAASPSSAGITLSSCPSAACMRVRGDFE
jgi:hypothetical protein